jgi:5'-nucleotidase
MKILVDMDGVLTDFDDYLKDRAMMLGWNDVVDAMSLPRKTLRISQNNRYIRNKVVWIMTRPGFFYSLKPLPGALEGIQSMLAAGHDVFICTSPVGDRSIAEKFQWIQDYLGLGWTERLILTGDKTMVDADFLIDDKPVIEGCREPTWEQIVFAQSYNVHLKGIKLRMDSWNDRWWEEKNSDDDDENHNRQWEDSLLKTGVKVGAMAVILGCILRLSSSDR